MGKYRVEGLGFTGLEATDQGLGRTGCVLASNHGCHVNLVG